MEKHGQAIGGIKSQMKIMRDDGKATKSRVAKLEFRIMLLLVSNGAFVASVMVGWLLN